ncbi:MAG: 23S rRNA pseudouridylate synthase B, partial [Gammaproteobacteria bacterium]|nr:23S rRNA pseudouridylate synthase B [Gammaproteobacteria bacterium]
CDSGGEGANHWYHVILKEGRNREVRRLWEAVGCTVSRLSRIRYGAIELGRDLKQGKWQDIPPRQIEKLANSVKLKLKLEDIYQNKTHLRRTKNRNSGKWGY